MRRTAVVAGLVAVLTAAGGPASACGGLIGPNGAVNLLRTSTLAGYHNGVEHYVTAFQFAGGGGAFGSLTPLPGVPSKVERGGDWTLQRLVRETVTDEPQALFAVAGAARADAKSAEVLLQVKVDALDITVLKGGGMAVGQWAKDHGFRLPPDAPEVLDFYAKRSPIFLAAAFDADAAKKRGQRIGDGTPVHITIPTANPWVPLRILALGKTAQDRIDADVYLLTDRKPALLTTTRIGHGFGSPAPVRVLHDAAATPSLLHDLNTDKGGGWVPTNAGWLTKLRIDGPADQVTGDLAIDATGQGHPSRVAAGFADALAAVRTATKHGVNAAVPAIAGLLVALVLVAVAAGKTRTGGAAA